MLDSELSQSIAYSEFLLRAVKNDLPRLIDTIKQSSSGYPTGHEGRTEVDEETGEAVTYDSRTQSAALHPDPARDARKELERNVAALRGAAVNLDGLRQAWLVTTKNAPVGTQPVPGCVSCERIQVTIAGKRGPKWVPCRALPKDPKGEARYSERCQFCDDWNRGEGGDPPLPVLNLHHDKGRVTSADLKRLGITPKSSARARRKAS